MQQTRFYPIGTPGQPWGDADRAAWRTAQTRQRSHADDVVARVDALRTRFDVAVYDQLDAGGRCYPLLAIRSRDWRPDLPVGVVTGGVHGYETSGVVGALEFLEQSAADFAGRIIIAPPSALADRWSRRFPDPVTAFASGWMSVRARARQRGVELPLILSDHADWDELTDTLTELSPQEVWITHGREEGLLRWAELNGMKARALRLVGYDEEDDEAAGPTVDGGS